MFIETKKTKRPTVDPLEAIMGVKFPILDHGHVVVLDYMGDDLSIVQAARTSYQAGTKKVSEDRGLIHYLMKHHHETPFEMCKLKLHVKMPIFVARQWVRHRMANINEQSARYSILPADFYVPDRTQLKPQSKTNKQGRGGVLSKTEADRVLELLVEDATRNYEHYSEMLNETAEGKVIDPEKDGLARELARMNLTLNYYTEWVWCVDLRNLLAFLLLRCDSHAQYEIRVYANHILENIVSKWVPMAHAAFLEHRKHAVTFSNTEYRALCNLISEAGTTGELDFARVKREFNFTEKQFAEFTAKLNEYGEGQ